MITEQRFAAIGPRFTGTGQSFAGVGQLLAGTGESRNVKLVPCNTLL